MKYELLIEKWLSSTPAYEAADVAEAVLVRAFGKEAVRRESGGSHQLRVKHPALANHPGFGPFGYLSVPISGGQKVKGYYLKRIAQAIRLIEEAEESGE